ncbi:MAG TPA: hypothetical protein VEB86_08535 [Chryseosolibacter sp.]|nr:hypothetical protein [Chryseosolibacter sp.]
MRIHSLTMMVVALSCASCASLKSPRHQLNDGHYRLKESGSKAKKVFIQAADDSLFVYKDNKLHEAPLLENSKFIKHSLDLDLITVAFKYRPSSMEFPRQLTADFNGNVYVGYRTDQFTKYSEKTPAGIRKTIRHRALTLGAFAGIGSTAITPWTTNYRTTDEYSALVITKGVAAMAGVNSLTIGLAIGWDAVTDRDKNIWIYQNKPWYGVSLGLSIN